MTAAQNRDSGTVSVRREWLEHVIKTLQGPLPSGHIGDCVFLLRDQLQDILDAPSPGLAQAAPVPDEPREVTPHWQRRWPHDQPNGWNLDSAGFLKLIQENPHMWLALGRAKYLEMRIDTRDGGFNLYDRDKKPLNPDDVIDAINKVRKDYGDPAPQSVDPAYGSPEPEAYRETVRRVAAAREKRMAELLALLTGIIQAESEFREQMGSNWEGDPLSDTIDAARRFINLEAPALPSTTRESPDHEPGCQSGDFGPCDCALSSTEGK